MDLFDDEELFKEQKKKVKRNSVVIISCIVVAVILIIGIVCAMMYFQSLEWGITVDGMGMPLKETTIKQMNKQEKYLYQFQMLHHV